MVHSTVPVYLYMTSFPVRPQNIFSPNFPAVVNFRTFCTILFFTKNGGELLKKGGIAFYISYLSLIDWVWTKNINRTHFIYRFYQYSWFQLNLSRMTKHLTSYEHACATTYIYKRIKLNTAKFRQLYIMKPCSINLFLKSNFLLECWIIE